jgi:hypothetical protein
MGTLGTVQDRIADDLNRSDLTTQIIKAINRAISFYSKEPFWFTETTSTFTTSDSAAYYTNASPAAFPTDIAQIKFAEITVNGSDYELEPWKIEDIQKANVTGTKNQPIAYAWWQNRIYTYPLANGAYPITLYHTKTYSEMSVTTSSNDFTTYAEDLIEARARKMLNMRVLKNAEEALVAQQDENEALDALRSKSAGHHEQSAVEPTDF